jgi:predicted MFS family arabinose efflux permease
VATVAAARQVAPDKAPQAVAVITSGLSLATVLGVPFTTYAADLAGWRYSFFMSGGINLVALAAMFFMYPPLCRGRIPSSST